MVQAFLDRLKEKNEIRIVAFGDSVTRGAFEPGAIDDDKVYHARLARLLKALFPDKTFTVKNAGVGGTTASRSLYRLEDDLLSEKPDLAIVSFALNDVNEDLPLYINSLATIFRALTERGIPSVFMTPNMMNRKPAFAGDGLSEEHVRYSYTTAQHMRNGRMDHYVAAAKECAARYGIPVADTYARWSALASAGVDTDALLANHINHPLREMHELFAITLLETLLF